MKKKLLLDGKCLIVGGPGMSLAASRYIKENTDVDVVVVGAGDMELERGVTIHDKELRKGRHDPFGPEPMYITSQGSYDYPFFDDAPRTKKRGHNNRKIKPRKKARNGPSGKKRKK